MQGKSIPRAAMPCRRCEKMIFRPRCPQCGFYNAPGVHAAQNGFDRLRDTPDTVRCHACKAYLGELEEFSGRATFYCRTCKARTTHESGPRTETRGAQMERFLEEMQIRWEAFRVTKLRQKGAVAVGLRFKVFMRDGFRCRYCGVSVDSGTVLHADHVIPESKGGPTTLDNLVTACIDCNLGKSDKLLDIS